MRLAFAALFSLLLSTAHASPLPPYPLVTATGKATVWMAPNYGELKFEILGANADAAAAQASLAEAVEKVVQLLNDTGIPAADITAYDIVKKQLPVARKDENTPPVMHQLTRYFKIVVRDLTKWSELVTPLSKRSDLLAMSVDFGRTDESEIRQRLVKEAAEDAKNQATVLAVSFGRKLAEAVAISQAPVGKVALPLGLEGSAPAGQSNTSRLVRPATATDVPGALPFNESVYAVFKLK